MLTAIVAVLVGFFVTSQVALARDLPGYLFMSVYVALYFVLGEGLGVHPFHAVLEAAALTAALVLATDQAVRRRWLPRRVEQFLYGADAEALQVIFAFAGGVFAILRSLGRRPERCIDPDLGVTAVGELDAALDARDWDAAAALVAEQVPSMRDFLIARVAERHRDGVAGWTDAMPDSALAHLVHGRCLLARAWAARGTGTAGTVSAAMWERFQDGLEAARTVLERAAELDPNDAAPYTGLIQVAMATQGASTEEASAHFREAQARDPENFDAHRLMLHASTERWGGSHEAMFALLERTCAELAPGHPLYGLVPLAHIDAWFDTAGDGAEGPGERLRAAYFDNPEVRDAIERAYRVRFPGEHFDAHPDSLLALNAFAFAFLKMREPTRARRALSHIAARAGVFPWSLYRGGLLERFDVGFAFSAACRDAGVAPEVARCPG